MRKKRKYTKKVNEETQTKEQPAELTADVLPINQTDEFKAGVAWERKRIQSEALLIFTEWKDGFVFDPEDAWWIKLKKVLDLK